MNHSPGRKSAESNKTNCLIYVFEHVGVLCTVGGFVFRVFKPLQFIRKCFFNQISEEEFIVRDVGFSSTFELVAVSFIPTDPERSSVHCITIILVRGISAGAEIRGS